ncbi:MAG: hypothetical protein Tsb002_23810 [Wenzhouxiangellaceae bacterium]
MITNNPRHRHLRLPSRQRGSALFLGILILIVLTLLAVVSSSNSVLQERMTGNFRDQALAFQAAENGLRWAEGWIASRTNRADPLMIACPAVGGCPSPIIANGVMPQVMEQGLEVDWTPIPYEYGDLPSAPGTNVRDMPMVAQQPKYVIEEVFFAPDNLTEMPQTGTFYYNITARGVGARPTSIAVVRSEHTRRVD